jgi:hypothetical protein
MTHMPTRIARSILNPNNTALFVGVLFCVLVGHDMMT